MINVAVQEAQNRDLNEIDSDSDNHVGETTSETFLLSSKFDFEQYTLDDSVNFDEPRQTTSERRSEVHFTLPTKLHEKDFQELFEKLNQDQRDYVMHVSHHFLTSNEQIFHFLTGGAGMAAFNINGQTLHSAFKIRPNTDVLENLSAGVSNTLACTLHCLKVLIIDEISMVSQHILEMVSKRLQHLKGNNVPFGGISVIVVGDFSQLNPVFGRSLISPSLTNPYAEIFGKNLWCNFKVFQLTKIMRQNEVHFQTALNNLAKGKLTQADKIVFQSRVYKAIPSNENLTDATHLFATNKNVDNFNDDAIKKIPGPEHICEASDILQGYGTELAKRQLMIIKPLSKTDYLYQEIKRWKRDKIIPVFNNIRDQTAFQIMYHNVQSLPKHINLITNDLNFTCNDVLCFGELWMSQYDTTAIPSYNMIHSIVSRNQRKPIGVCIYVKKAKQKFIKKSGTFTLSASKYRIDTVWLTIHNHTVFALYGTPGTPQQLWKKWFNTMHSLQSGKIIILGDFNFNSQQLPCAFEQLFRKYDLELKNRNMVTTHQKTSLDWIVSNNEQLLTGTYVSYFSYHHPIWARMASCRQ
ncbi:ATP-dependent DNA helicase RRM3 [Frankliniella fusca]|uniref:ATP-dependent DNA helicase n=1 Tax=Frankliniella fusca TaxID=407009 RepID=A0AAE1HP39_9NEOP|nr:ATP-dependent DNA helicase RRM3 [Frankliniella fusca]